MNFLESEEALFLHYLEYKRSKATVQRMTSGTARSSSDPEDTLRGSYMPSDAAVHECWYATAGIDDDCCGTIDIGCQRTAVGSETLARLINKQPKPLKVSFKPEEH